MDLIPLIAECLQRIEHSRFFETERGFQGEFLANLRAVIHTGDVREDVIVEQEYQKRLKEHGITLRPDIIVHVPTPKGGDRREGNLVVLQFKLRGDQDKAQEDFENLDAILQALNYPTGAFVNIADARTHAEHYAGPYPDRIHCFAVERTSQGVRVVHARPGGAMDARVSNAPAPGAPPVRGGRIR
jgi:hypothetical protein